MNVTGHTSRRELTVVVCVWIGLVALAIIAIAVLHANAARIIYYIEYVKEGRYEQAQILYLESRQNARVILQQADQLNRTSQKKVKVDSQSPAAQNAVSAYVKASRMDPREAFAADRRVDYDFAAQVYDALGDASNQSIAHISAFLCARDYPDADALLNQAKVARPADQQLTVMAARRYELEGATSRALSIMNDLYSCGSVPEEGRRVMGRLLLADGQTSRGISEMELALKSDPDYLDLRKEIANAYQAEGESAKAAEIFAGGENRGGQNDSNYLHLYGTSLLTLGKAEQAVKVLEKAVELNPNSGTLEFSLAEGYQKLGKNAQARRHLARARELDSTLNSKEL